MLKRGIMYEKCRARGECQQPRCVKEREFFTTVTAVTAMIKAEGRGRSGPRGGVGRRGNDRVTIG